jgi:pantetheine-phosphate adenylyltransferase
MKVNDQAIYAGTFDPVTFGHLDIASRAHKLFPKLIIAIAAQPEHKGVLFNIKERVDMFRHCLSEHPDIEVVGFDGLLAEFAREREINIIIRGLRAVADFEGELMMTLANRTQNRDLETIFLMPSYRWLYLTSSIVREIAKMGGKLDTFVQPYVAEKLRQKFVKSGKA